MSTEELYKRVRNCGLEPTAVPTVWQTLDEQGFFYVPIASTLDEDEKISFWRNFSGGCAPDDLEWGVRPLHIVESTQHEGRQ
jgi:hypothetical protein